MAAANSGVTRRQRRVYFVDCKGILTPILRTWVQKSTLFFQNRDPCLREIRNAQSMLAFGQYEMKSSEASRLSVGQFKCGLNR